MRSSYSEKKGLILYIFNFDIKDMIMAVQIEHVVASYHIDDIAVYAGDVIIILCYFGYDVIHSIDGNGVSVMCIAVYIKVVNVRITIFFLLLPNESCIPYRHSDLRRCVPLQDYSSL